MKQVQQLIDALERELQEARQQNTQKAPERKSSFPGGYSEEVLFPQHTARLRGPLTAVTRRLLVKLAVLITSFPTS